MKKCLLFVCCLLVCHLAKAQNMGLYFANGVLQNTLVNPSFFTDKRIVYAFPGVGVQLSNSIGAYNSLIAENAEGTTVLNTRALLNHLDDYNFLRAGFELYTLHVQYGGKQWRVSVSHALKGNTYLGYPKGLVELGVYGNAEFLGETPGSRTRRRF